jgi:hypothetical protein
MAMFRLSLLVLLLFGLTSCSTTGGQTQQNPVFPSESDLLVLSGATNPSEIGATSDKQHFPFLSYRLIINPVSKEIEVIPDRELLAHYNVTSLLNPPKCADCLRIKIQDWDPGSNEITLLATLRNPTAMNVYDVRLILDANKEGYWFGDPVTELCDGYTQLWNIWGESRNTFSAFVKSDPLRMFPASTIKEQSILFRYPAGSLTIDDILVTVDVCWPGNCKEPYEITDFQLDATTIPDHNSTVGIGCKVHGWPGNTINTVIASIEPFDDTGALYTVDLINTSGDLYEGILCPSGEVNPGHYRVWLKANSLTESATYMWQLVDEVDVIHIPGQWDYEWARTWGGEGNESCRAVAGYNNETVYGAGFFTNTVDFDPGSGKDEYTTNAASSYLVKYLSDGRFVWVRCWGDQANSIVEHACTDYLGNVYVTGYFATNNGPIDFDPGPGEDMFSSSGNNDVFLCKYTPDGVYKWGHYWGSTGDDYGRSIASDSYGNIYVIGNFRNTVDFDPGPGVNEKTSNGDRDCFLSKFDNEGNLIWVGTWGGTSYDYGFSVSVDYLDNVYVAGLCFLNVDLDPGDGTYFVNHASPNLFLSKFNSNCDFLWGLNWAGNGDMDGWNCDVTTYAQDEVYISGYFSDTVDFDPGIGESLHTSKGSDDVFLLKLNDEGAFQWANCWGGTIDDIATGVDVDSAGNIHICGEFKGLDVDFDPGPGTDLRSVVGNQYSPDAYMSKFDSNGEYKGCFTVGGEDGSLYNDSGLALVSDDQGGAYFGGYFNGTADFDPGADTDYHSSNGDQDAFLVRVQVEPVSSLFYDPIAFATYTADHEPPLNCETINFKDNGSVDPDGGTLIYEWDFDFDPSNGFVVDEEGSSVYHSWDLPGIYKVQFRVTDDEGAWDILDSPMQVQVNNGIPVAVGYADKLTVQINEDIQFDGSGSYDGDCNGESLIYEWDFYYDGTFETWYYGPSPTRSYPNVGNYNVQLRVTDNEIPSASDLLNTPIQITVTPFDCPSDNNNSWSNAELIWSAVEDKCVSETDISDWYYFYTQWGIDSATIDLNGLGGNADVEVYINPDGSPIASSQNSNSVEHIDLGSNPALKYYIKVYRVSGGPIIYDLYIHPVWHEPDAPFAFADADPAGVSPKVIPVNTWIHFFDDGSYDPDGGLINLYEWDWENDGQFDQQGQDQTHGWLNPGQYEVQFRVTDDENQTAELASPIQVVVTPADPCTWDTTPPETFIDSGCHDYGYGTTAIDLYVSGTDNCTPPYELHFQWRLSDDGISYGIWQDAPNAPAQPVHVPGLLPGSWWVQVRARDEATIPNYDPTPALCSFNISGPTGCPNDGNDNPDQAYLIGNDDEITGMCVDQGDPEDWYKFVAPNGIMYGSIHLNNNSPSGDPDLYLYATKPSNPSEDYWLTSLNGTGQNEEIILSPHGASDYYLRVVYAGGSPSEYDLSLNVQHWVTKNVDCWVYVAENTSGLWPYNFWQGGELTVDNIVNQMTWGNNFWNGYGYNLSWGDTKITSIGSNGQYYNINSVEEAIQMHEDYGQFYHPDSLCIYYVDSIYDNISGFCAVRCDLESQNSSQVFIVLSDKVWNNQAVTAHESGHAFGCLIDQYLKCEWDANDCDGIRSDWRYPSCWDILFCDDIGSCYTNIMGYSNFDKPINYYNLTIGGKPNIYHEGDYYSGQLSWIHSFNWNYPSNW